jgi:hypothetical protein
MLRNLLILSSTSGIVLFQKDWVSALGQKSKQIFGGLFTSIQALAAQTVGLPVSYIQLSALAVSVARDQDSKLCCYLLHDASAGEVFGGILASEILSAFVEEFAEVARSVTDMHKFTSFSNKIPDCINSSLRAVLDRLHRGGFGGALLTQDDRPRFTAGTVPDPLSLLANLQELMSAAGETMQELRDTPQELTISLGRLTVFIHKLTGGYLIAILSATSVPDAEQLRRLQEVREAKVLLDKVLELKVNLHGRS